jgi:hypothetical protein
MVRAGLRLLLSNEPTSTLSRKPEPGPRRSPRLAATTRTWCSWTSTCRAHGLEATRRIMAADCGAKVLILTTFNLD